MRNAKYPLLRQIATLFMILSMMSMSVFTAAAAPGQSSNAPRAQAQSVEVCANLIDLGFLGVDGNLADAYVGLDVGALLPLVNAALALIDLDGLEVDVLAQVLAGGCAAEEGPDAGYLTVVVTDADGNIIPGATVAFDGIDESGTVSPGDGSFTTSTTYAPADYTFTASADGYVTQSGSISVIDGNAGTTVVLALAEVAPAPGYLTVVVTDADGNIIPGATVAFDGIDESGTVYPNDGSFTTSTTYAPDTYTFTASADGYVAQSGTVSVVDGNAGTTVVLALVVDPDPDAAVIDLTLCVALDLDEDGIITQAEIDAAITAGTLDVVVDADVIVALLAGGCDEFLNPVPAPTMGTVDVQKFYCDSVTAVEFDGDVADDCLTGAATFTFYLIGDGTDANDQLMVYENGFGSIDLVAGDYEVVEEGTQATATITVTAGETTTLVVENPGQAPAPRYGTVNASAFSCSNIDSVEFFSDNLSVMSRMLPTEEPACDPASALFTFYLVGDGTNAYEQLAIDGSGSIQLAPGTYEVVEENTQARVFIDVLPGDFTTLVINIPTGENAPGTSVNVVKYYCDTVIETEFLVVDAGTSNREELPGAPDCAPGAATFTFYLVGDGTDDNVQLEVNGAGTIGLLPGTYEVVEEGTLATYTITVVDGENTLLIVNNPMPEDGVVPGTPGDSGSESDGDTGSDSGKSESGKKAEGVKALPSTGSGHVADGQAWMLMAGAAVLSAVGFQITRRQTNS